MKDKAQNYTVKLVGAAGLSADQRSATELRFRMALEAGVGGREYVVPALQACMLARSLLEPLSPDEVAEAAHDAVQGVIALWENAEDKAIVAALKPLGRQGDRSADEARFEIGF